MIHTANRRPTPGAPVDEPSPAGACPDAEPFMGPSGVRVDGPMAAEAMMHDPLPGDGESRRLLAEFDRLWTLDHLLSRAPSVHAPRFERRQAVVDALWARAPFREGVAHALPEIAADELTLARFLDLSQGHHRPVVIRGFGAASAAVREWTAERLAARVGPLPIVAAEMDRSPGTRVAISKGLTLHEMPLTEFVERMRDEPLYLHNSSVLTDACPSLLEDMELDRIRQTLCDPDEPWDPIFSASLFVGTGQVYSNLHTAPGGNFFLQVRGRKRWSFVHPHLSPYLMPLAARPFNHARSVYGTFHTAPADCPIHRLPRYTVTLEPGDLLYNAPWWWHEVLNEGETIGCAMRYVAPPLDRSPTWHNHRLFAALSMWPQLWAASLLDYGRHRIDRLLGRARGGTLRRMVGRRTDRAVNHSRGRSA